LHTANINNKKVINLDYDTFKQSIKENSNAVILDVRTKMEFDQGRIENSILIDFTRSDFLPKIQQLDKTKKYLVYCRSGNRSYFAVIEMLKMGFVDVAHLSSGIIGWRGKIEC